MKGLDKGSYPVDVSRDMTDPTESPQAALENAWGHQMFPTPHKPLSGKSGGKSASKPSNKGGRGGKQKRAGT